MEMEPTDFRLPSETVRRTPPLDLSPHHNKLFDHELTRHLAAVTAVQGTAALVDGNSICVVKKNGMLTPINLWPRTPTPKHQILRAVALFSTSQITAFIRSPSTRVRNGIVLTDAYFDGFFHWYGDILPKLEALCMLEANLSAWEFLIPANRYTKFAEHTLNIYGVRHRSIKSGTAIAVDNLCIIPPLAPTGNYRPLLMQRLRKRLQGACNHQPTSSRYYLSRRRARKRRLRNETEAAQLASKYDYTPIVLEDLNPSEQLSLMSHCDSLVGLHGAGLSHMLASSDNTSVIEIRGDTDSRNNCYFSLASALNNPYYYVPATPLQRNRPPHLTDYTACLTSLEDTLIAATSGRPALP